MALSNLPFFPQALNSDKQTFLPADTTTIKAVSAAATNGSKVSMLQAVSTDTTARDVILYVTISAVSYPIGQISIPITAGQLNSAPTINLLNSSQLQLPLDANGNPYLYLGPGATLSASAATTVTTAKQITLVATREDY
jgi:hypothetical protein